MKKLLGYLLVTFLILSFFSYKLIEVPTGLTIDEGAFGYNAVLLSETLRDENNRLLPVFVLSINGKDWRQPVTQYYMAAFFKLFGPSVYNLRFTSVIVATLGVFLVYVLGKHLLGNLGGVFSALFFATTPIIMIHSHLGLDNIAPIPFVIGWLLFVYLFEKKRSIYYLVFAAISLGIGFYSYKGMRSFVPVWSVLTVFYLLVNAKLELPGKNILSKVKPSLIFALSLAPFFLIIPLLEYKYAGAVLSGASVKNINSIYTFFHSYLASFDPSFLFIKGDELMHHSTGKHGMLLFASLPFFCMGLFQAVKKGKYWGFLAIAFFTGPLLFGVPGSVHRASRLIALVPIYSLISALGASWLISNKKRFKTIFVLLVLLFSVNYYDFINYYWFEYPQDTYHIFYRTDTADAYKTLSEEADKRGLTPYVSYEYIRNEAVNEEFLRSIYYLYPPAIWREESGNFPENGILLSGNEGINFLNKLETDKEKVFLYIKDDK